MKKQKRKTIVEKNSSFSLSIKFFVLIAIILSIVFVVSLGWHSFPIENPQFALSLKSYDTEITGKDACFSLYLDSQNLSNTQKNLVVKINDEIVKSQKLVLPAEKEKDICLENSLFASGENLVQIDAFSRSVFFHVEKKPVIDLVQPKIELLSFTQKNEYSADVNFFIVNPANKVVPLEIFLNGEKIRETFFPDGEHSETVSLVAGENKIKLSFIGEEKESQINNVIPLKSNPFIGIVILSLLFFVLITFVFSKKDLIENIVFSIGVFFVILMIIFFVLNYLGILSNLSFISLFIIITILAAVIFRKNFSIPEIKLSLPDRFTFFLGLFLIVILLFNFITPTNVSFWTSFYERQSQTVYQENIVPFFDEYTHFGEKPYGYLSGYFFVNAGISYLLGEQTESAFAIIMFLANLSLFLSAIVFFRKIGFDNYKSKLVVMLLLIGGFLLGDVFFNERHIIALALMFISLIMLFDKKKYAFVFAGAAMWVQPPIAITFIIISFALINQKFKYLIKYWIFSGIIGLVFFIPTFVLYGLPTQAKPTTWGYLFGMPWYGVAVDLLAQLIFFFAIMLPLVSLKPTLDNFSKKLVAIVFVLVLIELFVSYRVNVATTILFSIAGVYLLPKNILNEKVARHLLLIIFIGGTLFASSILLNFVVPDYAISSTTFLTEHTPSEARFLVEPALGHYTIYFSHRKVMADLAVEYSNAQLIDESFYFLENGDKSILEKNNIDYVFNRATFIETQPVGSVERDKPIEFTFLDKIYDNSVFFVHRTR